MAKNEAKDESEQTREGGEGVDSSATADAGVGFVAPDKILDKWVLESDLPDRLGISRSFLRRLRVEQLQPEEWRQTPKGIEVSLEAVKAIVGADIPESCATEDRATLTVQHFWSNPHLLGCSRSHETDLKPSEMQIVRVRNHNKFTRGMEIPCKRPKGDRVWSLACRHPTKKGVIKI